MKGAILIGILRHRRCRASCSASSRSRASSRAAAVDRADASASSTSPARSMSASSTSSWCSSLVEVFDATGTLMGVANARRADRRPARRSRLNKALIGRQHRDHGRLAARHVARPPPISRARPACRPAAAPASTAVTVAVLFLAAPVHRAAGGHRCRPMPPRPRCSTWPA